MILLILVLGIILLVAILVTLIALLIDWTTHIEMTKSNSTFYGSAGYKTFIEEFNKVKWQRLTSYSNSLTGKSGEEDYFHASIIKFNDKGMVINNPFSWFFVKRYVNKQVGQSRKIKEWR